MAKGYRPVDRDQRFLMPPDMREWLPADHPVWLVIAALEQIDTAGFHRHRRTGGVGRAGYHPDMLLTLLVWAWLQGVRSSRRIERACQQDVAFRVICAGDVPDFSTIARFRAATADACQELFTQVLMLCARLGMGRVGVVTLDGTKIASDASSSANRTEEHLAEMAEKARRQARQAAAEHEAADAAEDETFGPDGRGDRVPADAARPAGRQARIARILEEMRAEREAEQAATEQKLIAWRAERAAGRTAGRAPGGAASEVALITERLEAMIADRERFIADYRDRRRAAEAAGTPTPGRREVPVVDTARVVRVRRALARAQQRLAARQARNAARPRKVRNTTDPESRPMPLRGGGWLQGYNCQAVTSSDGLIIATGVTNNPADVTCYQPAITAAAEAAALIAAHRPDTGHDRSTDIGLVLADAGYLSRDNLTCPGPDRLIAVGTRRDLEHAARHHTGTGPAEPAGPVEQMKQRLRSPEGITAYRQRAPIAEGTFGNIKHNLAFRRFTGRGITRATAEWAFNAAVHNLHKALTSGRLATITT